MPRPSAPPQGATAARGAGADDPWRERIATVEVQLSATRATATRASQDVAAARERADAASARVEALEASLRASIEALEQTARDALSRAERPLPLQEVDARVAEIETIAQNARAGVAALRQELAENRRLDEARAVRLASIEDRVGRLEEDPRPAELRLSIDRVEQRVIAAEREQQSIRDGHAARSEPSPPALDLDRVRASIERVAALESRVAEMERRESALAEELASLRTSSRPAAPRSPGARTSDGLRSIAGIGPKMITKLQGAGISDREALAALDDEARARLAREIGVKRDKLDSWCDAARAIATD